MAFWGIALLSGEGIRAYGELAAAGDETRADKAGGSDSGASSAQSLPPDAPSADGDAMKPFVVSEPIYKAYLSPPELQLLDLYRRIDTYYEYGPQGPNFNGSFIVTPLREPQHPRNAAFAVLVVPRAELGSSPAAKADDVLGVLPDLGTSGRVDGLDVRSKDRIVSLRGVGTQGGGARVLLDGVPLNDPFGGGVPWDMLPRDGLARVELVPGGGATAWGGELGGTVQVFTLPPNGELVTRPGALFGGGPPDPALKKQVVEGTGQVAAEVGDFGMRSLDFQAAQPTSRGVLQVMGSAYSTDGYSLVSPSQRGPVDTDAWGRHEWLQARWRQLLGKGLVLTTTVRGSKESHGDGTPYQQGNSTGKFASVAVSSHIVNGFAWNGVAYVQDAGSSERFGFVNIPRTAETPVLDQRAQPVAAFGASLTGSFWDHDGSSTSAGVDSRAVRGETREDYAFSGGAFTRGYISGGEQGDLGAFVLRDQALGNRVRALLGARVDAWDEEDGHQELTEYASGATLGNARFPASSGLELSPSVAIVWRPTQNWRLHVNAQQGFSRPTLGELYRPFGSDSIVTEPDARLRTAHNTSFEASAEYTFRFGNEAQTKAQGRYPVFIEVPAGSLVVSATTFANGLLDAVGTVALSNGAGSLPVFGIIPSGYAGQQLLSLDRSTVQGASISAQLGLANSFSISAMAVLEDGTIGHVSSEPQLAGKQLAGVARSTTSIAARWRARDDLTIRCLVRLLGRQYEDDENTRRLGAAGIVDLGLDYAVDEHVELFLAAENLGNAHVATSTGPTGVVFLGSPRMVRGGVRLSW